MQVFCQIIFIRRGSFLHEETMTFLPVVAFGSSFLLFPVDFFYLTVLKPYKSIRSCFCILF